MSEELKGKLPGNQIEQLAHAAANEVFGEQLLMNEMWYQASEGSVDELMLAVSYLCEEKTNDIFQRNSNDIQGFERNLQRKRQSPLYLTYNPDALERIGGDELKNALLSVWPIRKGHNVRIKRRGERLSPGIYSYKDCIYVSGGEQARILRKLESIDGDDSLTASKPATESELQLALDTIYLAVHHDEKIRNRKPDLIKRAAQFCIKNFGKSKGLNEER